MTSTTATLLTCSYASLLALELLALLLGDAALLMLCLRPVQWAQQALVRYLRHRTTREKRAQLTALLLRMLALDCLLYMPCATVLLHWRLWGWFAVAALPACLAVAQMWREYVKEIVTEDGTQL
jgi:hypothetical protein